jgi:hypothetical protein
LEIVPPVVELYFYNVNFSSLCCNMLLTLSG